MLAELTRENVERGARLGGPNAAANVYALHNLGQADGTSFLNAFKENPQRRVACPCRGSTSPGRARLRCPPPSTSHEPVGIPRCLRSRPRGRQRLRPPH
jgi:hypothetical protein